MEKRAYLAQFLVDVEIPTDFLLEEDVNLLHAQYDALRAQFKDVHWHLENVRQTQKDPIKMKQEVEALESERDHVQSKVLKFKRKLQDVEKSDEMLEILGRINSQMIEEKNLAKRFEEQRQAMDTFKDNYGKARSKLQQMKILLASSHDVAFFDKMLQENATLQFNAKEKLPKDIELKKIHLRALNEILTEPKSEYGLPTIQAKLVATNEELRILRRNRGLEKLQKNNEPSKEELLQWQQTQMGMISANLTRVAVNKVINLTERRDKLQKNVEQKNAEIEQIQTTIKHGGDFNQYVDALQTKTITYTKMKKEIEELASKYEDLVKTQHLLEQKAKLPQDYLAQIVEISTDNLNPVNDRISGKNLHKMIAEIDILIKETRGKLTPQVKDLKVLRADLQALEFEQAEKKQHFNDMSSLFDRKVAKLEADIATYSQEFETENQRLKENAIVIERLQASLLEVNMEKEGSAVSKKLNLEVEQQHELLSNLQQKQQKQKEIEHSSLLQMAMMKDLLTILATKLNLQSLGLKPPIFSTITSLETGDQIG